MFAEERIQKIKRMLIEYKKVDVSSLSGLLSVSEVTIRKDLERLENEGFLTRTHGGAILVEDIPKDEMYKMIDIPEIEHKKMIGLIGAQMVNNNEAIFLGSGTTCLQIAKNLSDKRNLTVVTNNVSAALEIGDVQGIKVILIGGNLKYLEHTYSSVGPSVVQSLKDIYVNNAFIGVNGISFKRGYTVHDSEEAAVASEIVKCSNNVTIVADSTKYDKIAFCQVGMLSIAKKVISDELVPEEYLKYFFENDIQIFTTYKLDI